MSGVPQFLILRQLLFIVFLNKLLLLAKHSDLKNFSDDKTSYSSVNNLEQAKRNLAGDFQIVQNGFTKIIW